jgi:hypothetical protein
MRAHVTAALNEAQDNGVRPLAAGTATGLVRELVMAVSSASSPKKVSRVRCRQKGLL